jgi:aminoglycoside phosphotransferase family enzyme/predicted kinase
MSTPASSPGSDQHADHGAHQAERPDAVARAWQWVSALQQCWGAQLVETHISWVLLDGTHAWKFKKPVRLPFLDFSALAERRRLCLEELHLNQRLAPELYLDVQVVSGSPEAPALRALVSPGSTPKDDGADVLDYVLRMQQFPADALMSTCLAQGRLHAAHMDALALRLARFHQEAPHTACTYGSPAGRWASVDKALRSLEAMHAGHAATEARLRTLRAWATQEAQALQALWAQRQAQGAIVEGHGDLHLGNIVVLADQVTAFDCIEFDPALRWLDPVNDIAFLAMDLLAHQRADLAWRFVNAWLDASGEHAGLPSLRYDMVYRALVRAMVAGLRHVQQGIQNMGQHTDQHRVHDPDYLAAALALTKPMQPGLLITHGVSGSGKSWQTQQLLQQVGAIRLRSDVERRRLGLGYSREASQATYAHLLKLADMALQAGYPVIVDATFLREADRACFIALAHARKVPVHVLHCEAPEATLRQRIRDRLAEGHDASQANEAVLTMQLASSEPLTDAEQALLTTKEAWQTALQASAINGLAPRQFDVCNGDADGLCATVQWRLQHPQPATLVTGLKRDIALLGRVNAQAGDEVQVFDVSMRRNQAALQRLLQSGAKVRYADHHDAGEIPVHEGLSAHIDLASDMCTSRIVDGLLHGAQRGWALVGIYGDNLRAVADEMATASGFSTAQADALRRLGEAINYNAYGETDADVCMPPAQLFELMLRYPNPLDFMAQEPIATELLGKQQADMQAALALQPHWQSPSGALYMLPDAPWARRVSGTFANALVQDAPNRAYAVLTPLSRGGAHVVSVRAPLRHPFGADTLCQRFQGNGRARAAGVDALDAMDLPAFIEAFAAYAESSTHSSGPT